MNRETYDENELRQLLAGSETIAIVGASPNPARHSHRVMRYLQANGYKTLPVNPLALAEPILGETVFPTLAEVPGPIDIVDVFRRQEAIAEIGQEVLDLHQEKQIRAVWLQLDLYDADLAAKLRAAGLTVVMDRCLKIEHGRLLGATD